MGLSEGDPTTITFTRRDIREFSGWSHYRVHIHLNELLELQYVLSDVRGPAGPHRYRLASSPSEAMTPMQSLGLKPVELLRQGMTPAAGEPAVGSVRVPVGSGSSNATPLFPDANNDEVGHSGRLGEHERCAKTPIS